MCWGFLDDREEDFLLEEPKLLDENIFSITKKERDIWYNAHFNDLPQLHDFIASNPKVNGYVFKEQSSLTNDRRFAGDSLNEALPFLITGCPYDHTEFLDLIKKIDSVVPEMNISGRSEPSYVGSRFHIPNAIAGSPKYMRKLVRVEEPKFITVYFNLAYPYYTTTSQILNRGILTINLVKMLEKNNYRVNLKTFELVRRENEICFIDIIIKKFGQNLDVEKCYFPFCRKEFLRRVCFRLKESMAFRNPGWGGSYGSNLSISEAKSLLELKPKDILIGYPDDIGIDGDSLTQDAIHFFRKIKLDNYVKIDEEKIKKLKLK